LERKEKTMTTHEVEEMLGITKQSLIYYEKEGLIHPKRNEIGRASCRERV